MKEIWKDIKGYEGLYQVSNLGNVKSLKTNKNLYYSNSNNGYLRVGLFKNKRKMFSIHRLVAENFIPNPNEYLVVNHKDFNQKNNKVDNLEWCTSKENNNYGCHQLKRKLTVIEKDFLKMFPNEYDYIKKLKDIRKFVSTK